MNASEFVCALKKAEFYDYCANVTPLVKLAVKKKRGVACESKHAVAIIESRSHSNLEFTIWNTVLLSDTKTIYVVCTPRNHELILAVIDELPMHARSRMIVRMRAVDINSAKEYSAMLKDANFWDTFECSRLMIVQTDALWSSKIEWSLFNAYVYIGAPWPQVATIDIELGAITTNIPAFTKYSINSVGNGGMSIRNVAWCKTACTCETNLPEDLHFANVLKNEEGLPCPRPLAKEFSSEMLHWPHSRVTHQPW